MESKKNKQTTETEVSACQGWGEEGKWVRVVKGYKLPVMSKFGGSNVQHGDYSE